MVVTPTTIIFNADKAALNWKKILPRNFKQKRTNFKAPRDNVTVLWANATDDLS